MDKNQNITKENLKYQKFYNQRLLFQQIIGSENVPKLPEHSDFSYSNQNSSGAMSNSKCKQLEFIAKNNENELNEHNEHYEMQQKELEKIHFVIQPEKNSTKKNITMDKNYISIDIFSNKLHF